MDRGPRGSRTVTLGALTFGYQYLHVATTSSEFISKNLNVPCASITQRGKTVDREFNVSHQSLGGGGLGIFTLVIGGWEGEGNKRFSTNFLVKLKFPVQKWGFGKQFLEQL